MKNRSKLALIGVSAIIPLSVFAGVGLADPSDLFVADVPPHRHFISTPSGKLVRSVHRSVSARSLRRRSSSSTTTSTTRSFHLTPPSTRLGRRTVPEGCTPTRGRARLSRPGSADELVNRRGRRDAAPSPWPSRRTIRASRCRATARDDADWLRPRPPGRAARITTRMRPAGIEPATSRSGGARSIP